MFVFCLVILDFDCLWVVGLVGLCLLFSLGVVWALVWWVSGVGCFGFVFVWVFVWGLGLECLLCWV